MGTALRRTEPSRPRGLRRLVGRANLPGLVSGLLSLALVVGLLMFLTQQLQPQLAELRQAQRTIRDAHDAMLDQETGVRGYLASGEEEFLEPYWTGAAELVVHEQRLSAALSGQPELIGLAIATITAQQAWQKQWAVPAASGDWESVADTDDDGVVTARETAVYLQAGKNLFDPYRQRDQALQAAVRAEIETTESKIARTLGFCGITLVLLALASIVLTVRAQQRLRRLVVAPLLQVTERVDRVRRGDFTGEPAPAPGVIEIGALASGVDEMTHAIVQRQDAAVRRTEELRAHGRRLQRVLDLSRDLTESLSLRYTTQRLISAVCELANATRVELWLQDSHAKELVLYLSSAPAAARAAARPPTQVVDVGVGAVGRAARYGRALPLDERLSVVDETTTGVAVPMVVGARVVAVVEIENEQGEPLDLSLLDGLLLQGASAIQAAQLHAEVEEMSHKDALTGLANRRQFDADLLAEVERAHRYDRPLALVMIDLDHFKKINDVYGHQRGDEVLQDVAGLLSADLREIDVCYRYGGEELCVLLPESTAEMAAAAAERIRARVEASFAWASAPPVTLSAGVAALRPGAEPAALVGAADQALYAAKHAGRNRVEVAPD
ncbi:diguanylate cyclase [Nocardioides sp. zg-536]|uniref:Diguanylate cyclase n=1 Tax=Nocardioides faecalis TaxID=2803858 RepID=A0A938Y8X4_9ACTN|nr:diguanylate cyclase [Nocardioides faecalis]MBM9460020.1 diguanylate cyclase [Nocardioides faecalis]MBS4753112.1 diguanylate cyclase [Nocardioides faecalis]QVI58759.1 diguanylate cyclase [Nocardioides faecalis]